MPGFVNIGSAGNRVVLLSDIIGRLRGKISDADMEALLFAVLTKKKDEVHPGDLITADLMNQILHDLAILEAKVAALSVERPDRGKGVVIDEPTARTIVRVNDPLVIKGENLLSDSLVMIEDKSIGGVVGSADNRRLTIRQLPAIDLAGGIPAAGARVTLQVINDIGSATTEFTVKPEQLTKPIGSITIVMSKGPKAGTKFAAGKEYEYTFKVIADTKPDEEYVVSASVGRLLAWKVAPSPRELLIPAARDARTPTEREVDVSVEIGPLATRGDTGHLVVTLTSKRDPTFTWSSQEDIPIEVGGRATGVKKVAFTLSDTTAGAAAIRTNADNSKTPLIGTRGGAGGTGQLTFTVSRTDHAAWEDGDYQVDMGQLAKLKGDVAQARWKAIIPGSATGKVKLAGASPTINVELEAKGNAGAVKLVLAVEKVGDASVDGYAEFDVERRA